jgi:hypothetical protein
MTPACPGFPRILLAFLAALLSSGAAEAQDRPPFMLARLIADGGRASLDGAGYGNTELGADLLLSANEKQRYGLRLSSLDIETSGRHQRYLCTGVVLEMVAFQWLRMEVGTVGFVGRGDLGGSNPFGLVSFLGYEKRLGRLNFSVGYDSKYIFAKPAVTIQNLGIGVGAHF